MKIIEALKELPLIDKKIARNINQIQTYSSEADNGHMDLPFGNAEGQKSEVASLLQSTNDLVARSATIRRVLAVTNATIRVQIDGVSRTIAEWISYRTAGFAHQIRALQAQNDKIAQANLNKVQFDVDAGVRIARFYDEKKRNDAISEVEALQGQIDARLEMVNATTDLVESVE